MADGRTHLERAEWQLVGVARDDSRSGVASAGPSRPHGSSWRGPDAASGTRPTPAVLRDASDADAPGAALAARAASRRSARLRDGIRGIVAVVGTLTIAWLGVAWFLGLSVIVLGTGSTTTATPSGSVAIVQQVEATNLTAGDVVAVPHQEAGTSVTRRIIDIATVPGRPDVRSLTLRGDANAIEDSGPYVLSEADRVLASSPHAGALFLWVQHPSVLLGASVLVTGAIAWVLWPSTGRAGAAGGRETADG